MDTEASTEPERPESDTPQDIINAKNLFRFLAEVKKLSSPVVRDHDAYEQVIWASDIPRYPGCYTKIWELIGQPAEESSDNWIQIAKPKLTAPPELPDSLELFVVDMEWRNSENEQPSLLEVSREQLIRHFLPDEDLEPEFENHSINDHEEVFTAYVDYVDEQWRPWSESRNSSTSEAPCPEPPDLLRLWLDAEQLGNYSLEEPPLNEEISIEVDNKFCEAKQNLQEEWQQYLDKKWHPWAEKDRKLQKIQKIYNELYSAYQRRQKLGEQYELVLGLGLLHWQGPKSARVRRHVLTVEAEIEFDARNGVIAIHDAPNGSVITVEDDMLHTEERPQPSEKTQLDASAKETAGDFWNQAVINGLATSFVNALQYQADGGIQNDGKFELNIERPKMTSQQPLIHLAPAIILRKRSQRGFIRLLEEIEEKIDNGGEIPNGIKTITRRPSFSNRTTGDSPSKDLSGKSQAFSPQEIYFPLPANKEQRQIVNYLGRGKGVRVQGPPGTGKSHTITNLICHLLASGQRVLVTSETERALRSLRSKFIGSAERLSDLAVILLGNDATSLKELEKSISAIHTKKEHWSDSDSDGAVTIYESNLKEIRERKRIAENDLKTLREADVYVHDKKFGRYSGTLQEIAQVVNREREEFEWLKDCPDLRINEQDILRVEAEKFVRLWYRWDLRDQIDEQQSIVDTEQLPTRDQLKESINQFNKLERETDALRDQADTDLLATIKTVDPESVKTIYLAAEPILAGLRSLRQHVFSWAFDAARDIVAEQDRSWKELFELTTEELKKCEKFNRGLSAIEINGIEDTKVRFFRSHVATALRFAREGKKVKKSLFHPSEYKVALKGLEEITLDGHPITTLGALEILDQWLEVKDALTTISNNWRGIAPVHQAGMSIMIAKFGDWLEPLEQALELHTMVRECQKQVDSLAKFAAPHWHVYEDLEKFCSTFALYHQEEQLSETRGFLSKFADLAKKADATGINTIGPIEKAVTDKDIAAYQVALDKTLEINKLHKNQNIVINCARNIRSYLPETFQDFFASNDTELWVKRWSSVQSALQWVRTSAWLEELTDPKAGEKINANIERYSEQERDELGKIAEEKAWAYCIRRLGEAQRQALMAWLHAIERIGKGTGKHAESHRRTARQKLQECQVAIPAWVMPLHRVVETVDATPEAFDVAIIDEASQSGSEALILNYIAKKVIVVGDDKQIRPQNIGVNHDDVEYLRKRYLNELPHSDMFDLKSSYFSQAAVRFPNQISLKEHFRCMPEIIQFSNKNFYQSAPLIPLKQFGSSRLEPTITEYVEDGYRQGSSSKTYNEPEARRLVERLAECCSDPAYEKKTFGVITLLGHSQSAFIEELLMNEIDPSEYEERKIMAGSAYAFQGDERDVVFISMVDAPVDGGMCRKETRVERAREFNVAASRAKEQMILFHSMTKNELQQDCLKYKLLDHCMNPSIEQIPVGDMSLNELREIVHMTERTIGNQPSPFESWFEVDVFLELTNRGYQLIPQYKVNPNDNSYRIDLVVMGMNGKLAVECDGDYWHGPAEYEKDMARQRELERCGWEFWRVRGGAYYRDPLLAMEPLWKLLDRRGIYPEGYLPPEKADRLGAINEGDLNQTNTGKGEQAKISHDVIEGQDELESSEYEEPEGDSSEDSFSSFGNKISIENVTPADIQHAILTSLAEQPNKSATLKSMPSRVCKELGIITRGAPRKEFEKKISHSVGVLKRQKKISEYKAKNIRIRLNSLL